MDHFHGLLVGIPQAVDKLGLLADLLEQLIDIGAAAVDQHRFNAQHIEQDDILHDGILEPLVDHGVAAVFDNNGFPRVFLHIRLRFGEHIRNGPFFHVLIPLAQVL